MTIILAFIRIYGFRYLVLKKKRVREAIKSAFHLFLAKWKESLLMGLCLLAINLIVGLGIFLALIILIVPFFLLGLIAHLLLSKLALVIVIILGMFTWLLSIFLIISVLTAFREAAWTLTFRKLED